jgi:hypothetical protein
MKKTKTTTKQAFDAVQFIRQVRDKISSDMANLSKEEIVEYFKKYIPKEGIIPRHISVTS